ncbi:MAG: glycosyltransferase family 2 protein [Anaerolineae bacterium]|jgi:GT2 family glycosyltransferase
MTPDVSIIVVNWNTRDLLASCLESLFRTAEALPFDVWVVDNGSTDGSVEMVRRAFPRVELVVNAENEGFARASNRGIDQSEGRYVLLFNTDAQATPGAIEAMFTLAETQPRAGIVGARLLNADGSFQASHTPFPTLGQEFLMLTGLGRLLFGPSYPSRGPDVGRGPRVVDYVEGACMLVRRRAIDEVGGLDEGYFMYAEEVDWCYAMSQAGWQVWYQPAATVVHLGGGSSQHRMPQREADLYRSRVRFFRKHYGRSAARMLALQIYALTAVKLSLHGLLRLVSGGRYGRPVVSLRQLATTFREA